MAHSRSALKRWRQSIRRRDHNRSIKSRTRSLLSKAISAVGDDAQTAEAAVRQALSALDKAAQKGVIHANAASRTKSRLLKRYNLSTAAAVAAQAARSTDAEAAPSETTTRRRRSGTSGRSAASGSKAAEKKPTTRSRAKKS